MTSDATEPTVERIAHSFAMKYGLRTHLTYEQAMTLERDLTTHLRAWTRPECGAIEPGPIKVGSAHVCDLFAGHSGEHGW